MAIVISDAGPLIEAELLVQRMADTGYRVSVHLLKKLKAEDL